MQGIINEVEIIAPPPPPKVEPGVTPRRGKRPLPPPKPVYWSLRKLALRKQRVRAE